MTSQSVCDKQSDEPAVFVNVLEYVSWINVVTGYEKPFKANWLTGWSIKDILMGFRQFKIDFRPDKLSNFSI